MSEREGSSGKGRSPTRDWVPDILRALADGPAYSTEIAKRLGTSRYNLYRYLDNLEVEGLVDHEIVGRMKLYRLTKVGAFEAEEMSEVKGRIYRSVEPMDAGADLPMHINAFTAAPRVEERERRTHVASVPVPAGPYRDIINEVLYKMEREDVLEEFEEIDYLVLVGPKRRR